MEKDKEKLLEDYFTGKLSSNQQEQLDWLLQHDSAFSETFKFEKETRDTILYSERQKIKARFRALDKVGTMPVRKLTTWWYAAASVVLLIGVAWFLWDKQAEMTEEKLYAQYMEPYPNMITPIVRGDAPADNRLSDALVLYDQQAYSASAVILQQIYDENPSDQTAFYLAICQLMLEKPAEAIGLLKTRSWQDSLYFSPTVVQWYLGLAFLQQGDGEKALPCFRLVAKSDSSLSDKASKVVKALK